MATELKGEKTFFLPFNQGSNGAGNDGGAGNPQAEGDDYVTSYIWKNVLQKDSLLDIIQKFISLEIKTEKKKDKNGIEKNYTKKRLITNALLPVQKKYNELNQEERYQFRRTCRSFVNWYNYISQIARLYDKNLHNEFVFCSYLAKIIPADPTTPFLLEDRVKLEYYSLEKTYEGAIELKKEEKGIYEPAKIKKPVKKEEKLSPLEEVIQKINEQYAGEFTEGDRVVITALHEKLKGNKKLLNSAKKDGQQMFEKNIFPSAFDNAAQEAYMESTETYEKMFSDAEKYKSIMRALAKVLFDEFR